MANIDAVKGWDEWWDWWVGNATNGDTKVEIDGCATYSSCFDELGDQWRGCKA